ncbi:MAG TPA: ATP synthase F1 subunit delta [Phycisphaerales bacterium]|nr:ATP synthase F1 subunit delta [Phycisphaerales bacterium]
MAANPATLIDSPPEAVDKIYAESLFQLADEQGGKAMIEQIKDEMDQIEEDLRGRQPQIREFLRSLIIGSEIKVEVLKKAFEGRTSPLLTNFVLLLARKERLGRLWQIFAAYDLLMQERLGKVEVDVYARYPLAPEQVETIAQTLRTVMKRDPVVHTYVDDTMIGGLRIQVGDKMLDASVDAQLRKMRDRLIQQGGGALRERIDRMFGE